MGSEMCIRDRLWVAEDVTERRRQEAELKAAKQQAEGASHAKSAFLATMSHEIRTPLNGVLGLARLLQQAGPDERRPQYVAHLVAAAESLNEIVSNVLDLSKIEAGELSISMDVFEPAALLDYLCDVLQAQAALKKISLSLEMPADLPAYVKGDALRLNQILTNPVSYTHLTLPTKRIV